MEPVPQGACRQCIAGSSLSSLLANLVAEGCDAVHCPTSSYCLPSTSRSPLAIPPSCVCSPGGYRLPQGALPHLPSSSRLTEPLVSYRPLVCAVLVIEEYDKLDCPTRAFFRQLLEHGRVANVSLNRRAAASCC
jgi:hypothetical protein